MLGWLFRILASLSAILCLACISLWIRSYWVAEEVNHLRYSFPPTTSCLQRIEIISGKGEIYLDRLLFKTDVQGRSIDRQDYLNQNGWSHSRNYFSGSASEYFVRHGGRAYLGFGYNSTTWTEPSASRFHPKPYGQSIWRRVLIPWPAPVLALAILPLLLLRSLMRSRRRRLRLAANLCASCGYDLRSSPENCPECGAGRISAVP